MLYVTKVVMPILLVTILLLNGGNNYNYFFEPANARLARYEGDPILRDTDLKVEVFAEGLEKPTSMAFLGPNDILVLEKNNGQVRRVVNNTVLPKPIIDLKVANTWEMGLLGIAVSNTGTNNSDKNGTMFSNIPPNENAQEFNGEGGTTCVFLYFTTGKLVERDILCIRHTQWLWTGF